MKKPRLIKFPRETSSHEFQGESASAILTAYTTLVFMNGIHMNSKGKFAVEILTAYITLEDLPYHSLATDHFGKPEGQEEITSSWVSKCLPSQTNVASLKSISN